MTFRMTAAEVQAHQKRVSNWRDWPNDHGQEPATAPPAAQDGVFSVTLPIRLVNGSNERAGWWMRSKRAKQHRKAVRAVLLGKKLPELPVKVTVTRLGLRQLDSHDNLRISAKHVVDAIAELYGLPDDSDQFEWCFAQGKGSYSAIVEIVSR